MPCVMQLMSRRDGDDRIFGVTTDSISKAFTEACKFLSINDLYFHDLRHEGISWHFEQGLTIPQVATVLGHKSWTSLQRYTQIRRAGVPEAIMRFAISVRIGQVPKTA